jgi:hypothetical protein
MSTYLLGVPGVAFVTGLVTGTVNLVPGFPIAALTVPQAAVLPSFVTHTDSVLARISDSDAIFAADIDRISGKPTQRPKPVLVSDAETIFSRLGSSARGCDSIAAATADTSNRLRPALVASDDAVYAFTSTRFTQPGLVSDSDAIPAADVGWRLFADAPVTDVDASFGGHAEAWAHVLPEVYWDEESTDTYPFRVQAIGGGFLAVDRVDRNVVKCVVFHGMASFCRV